MSDEQMIYISPEDDLTNVRERLERIPTRKVTLVIPSHTQLRSHVAWKLLYARARELGKEVLIISSDPQIRSVAHAVKFKVAHSLESSQQGKSRPPTRPGRTNVSGRGRTSSAGSQRTPRSTENTRSRQPAPSEQWYPAVTEQSPVQQEPESKKSRADETTTGGVGTSSSSTFEAPSYDYRVTSPPIRPLTPQQINEEPDLLLEDYHHARHIEQAAMQGSGPAAPSETPSEQPQSPPAHEPVPPYKIQPLPDMSADPFRYMEDELPPPSGEQHGAVSIEGFDTHEHVIQDAAEMPTSVIENPVEYQKDEDNFVPHAESHPWAGPAPEDEQDIVGPGRASGVRPRSSMSTTGNVPPSRQNVGEEVRPVPIEERTTEVTPQVPASVPAERRQFVPTPANRTSPQAPARRERPMLSRPLQGQGQQRSAARRTASGLSSTPARKSAAQRKSLVNQGIFIAVTIVLILLIGTLAYFGPSADVAITFQSRTFAHPVTLVGHAGNQPNATVGTVPVTLQTQVFSKSGTGTATNPTKVGTVAATGNVTFTNNGQRPVIIPSGTILATGNGIQFTTDAEASVNPPGSVGSTVVVPIHAVAPGDNGNVPAGSITTIPPDSLSAIAKANNVTVADLNLKVTNESPNTGGGVGSAISITDADITKAEDALHQLMKADINNWLHQLSTKGVIGNPKMTDTLVNPLKAGQIAENGTFPISLNTTVSVLFVNSADLQAATAVALKDAMRKDKAYAGDMPIVDANHPVKISQIKTPGGDTHVLTLNFTATAQTIPNESTEQIQKLIAGKSIKDATTTLSQLPDVQSIDIKPSPSFITWVPFWVNHINVTLIPGSPQIIPNQKPKP
ncbi:MAG: baseplate J/gp47 family protein [Chloroflexi bacterium]|nr:baseplate J/gp47 family protein [Chloroflexota bacterium]